MPMNTAEIKSNLTRVVTPAGIFELDAPTPRMSDHEPESVVFQITELIRDDGETSYLVGCAGVEGSELATKGGVIVVEIPKQHCWRVDQVMRAQDYEAMIEVLTSTDDDLAPPLDEQAYDPQGETPSQPQPAEPASLFETVSVPAASSGGSDVAP